MPEEYLDLPDGVDFFSFDGCHVWVKKDDEQAPAWILVQAIRQVILDAQPGTNWYILKEEDSGND